jgi:hypothetical protein
MARASAGSAAGAAGGTGGSTGGTGGSGGGGVTTLSVIDPVRDPPPRFRAQLPRSNKDSGCYQSQPMFDRWGDYVGKQQLPDYCY